MEKLRPPEYAAKAKYLLREAYKNLLKASELDGEYEYKDSIKQRLLMKAQKVIELTNDLG